MNYQRSSRSAKAEPIPGPLFRHGDKDIPVVVTDAIHPGIDRVDHESVGIDFAKQTAG